jgi:hypothetical protein
MSKILELAKQASQMKGWPFKVEASGDVAVEVPTESGRTQVVTVTLGKDGDQDPCGFVWSKAGELRSGNVDPWALLKLNSTLSYGKCAVRGSDIVVVHGLYEATSELADVGKAIYWCARSADDLEKSTYGAQTDVL